MNRTVETPRDAHGMVDHNAGWRLWTDFVRYYPSGVHRRRLVARALAPLEPSSVVDVGCGPGHLLDQLRRALPAGTTLVGVDNADETIAENRRRLPWARFEVLDLGRQHLAEQFEAVVCSEVLEHVPDDVAALAHLAAMTRRWLLVTVPTGPVFPLEAGFGHLRHYREDELRARIEAHGFRIASAQAWGFPFMSAFKRISNLRPQAVLDGFGNGEWSLPKKAVGAALTGLFYLNLRWWGPQLVVLAERR